MNSRTCAVLLLILGAVFFLSSRTRAGDDDAGSPLDSQRKAAQALVRGEQYRDALTLLDTIVADPQANFADDLMLARVQEKLGRTTDAAITCRHILIAIAPNPRADDERAARKEATAKLRTLDPESVQVDAAIDDFLKKIDSLTAEAQRSSDHASMDRLLALRSAVRVADGRGPVYSMTVGAADTQWKSTNVKVVAGQRYRITASGMWHVGPGDSRGDADGRTDIVPSQSGHIGALLATINLKQPYFPLGKSVMFVPRTSGTLYLSSNDPHKPGNDNGSLTVTIEPQ